MAISRSADQTWRLLGRPMEGVVLHGAEEAHTFLDAHFFQRASPFVDAELLPDTPVAMLYGREGSGKTTLVNYVLYSAPNQADFHMHDFCLQRWNMADFRTWIVNRFSDLAEIQHEEEALTRVQTPRFSRTLFIVIGGLQRFSSVRGQDDVFMELLHFLTQVRLFKYTRMVRVLLLCDESPGQFPQELLTLIDKTHLMTPPGPDARIAMFVSWMQRFHQEASLNPMLNNLGWDIALEASAIEEDAAHIIHTLVVASSGCTPREIRRFMRRTFAGCALPKGNGDTVYNAAWIESLINKLEGNIPSITPSNSALLNEPCFKYAGLGVADFTAQLGTNTKSCFVRDVPLVFNPYSADNAAVQPADEPAEDGEPDSKRPRADLQPPSVMEALQARLAQQGDSLATAARHAKRIAGRERNKDRE